MHWWVKVLEDLYGFHPNQGRAAAFYDYVKSNAPSLDDRKLTELALKTTSEEVYRASLPNPFELDRLPESKYTTRQTLGDTISQRLRMKHRRKEHKINNIDKTLHVFNRV